MNGKVQQKTISGLIHNPALGRLLEMVLLLGAGMLAVTLHARLRTPFNMPGHHGLEFMAILVMARSFTNVRWAGSVSSLGIGILLLFPILGFNDPFMGLNYMLPGFLLDLVYNLPGKNKFRSLLIITGCGFAYAMIPLSRLVLHLFTGYPYQNIIKHGPLLPISSFFFFGILGGITGLGLSQLFKLKN